MQTELITLLLGFPEFQVTDLQIEDRLVIVTLGRRNTTFRCGSCGKENLPGYDSYSEEDHVHILVSSPPTMAPSEIMRRLKGRTSSKLFEEFPHIRKRYWGQHFWPRGYFCATVRQLTEEVIQEYLEHHFEPRPNDDFRMEGE